MKVLLLALLLVFAVAQENDWHTCALDIVTVQTDVIELAYGIQTKIMKQIIPSIEKIQQECQKFFKNWDSCLEDSFMLGYTTVQQLKNIEVTITKKIIPDIEVIPKACSSWAEENGIPQCLEDATKIVELGKEFAQAVEQKQIQQAITLAKELYALLLQTKTDCQV